MTFPHTITYNKGNSIQHILTLNVSKNGTMVKCFPHHYKNKVPLGVNMLTPSVQE